MQNLRLARRECQARRPRASSDASCCTYPTSAGLWASERPHRRLAIRWWAKLCRSRGFLEWSRIVTRLRHESLGQGDLGAPHRRLRHLHGHRPVGHIHPTRCRLASHPGRRNHHHGRRLRLSLDPLVSAMRRSAKPSLTTCVAGGSAPSCLPLSWIQRASRRFRMQWQSPPFDVVPSAELEPHVGEHSDRSEAQSFVKHHACRVGQRDAREQRGVPEVAHLGDEPLVELPPDPGASKPWGNVDGTLGRPTVRRPGSMRARTREAPDLAAHHRHEPREPRARGHPPNDLFHARDGLLEGDGARRDDWAIDGEDRLSVRGSSRPDLRLG
jgi:hypothetical protein